MATGDQRVILWPYTIASGANTITFSNDAAGSNKNDPSLSAGTYMARGAAGGVSVGTDLCAALATALNAAYLAIYAVAGAFTVTLTDAGHLSITNGGVNPLWILWSLAGTTLDPDLLGWSGDSDVALDEGQTTVSDYQVAGRWHPRIPHVRDTGEHEAHVWAQGRTTQWTPWYVLHSELDNPAARRWLEWEHVSHARIFQSAADDADAAGIAGVATGDPSCAFESLLRYMLDDTAPYPHQVYVSDVEPPASATLSGRYYLVLDDSMVDAGGVPDAWEHDDTTQYQYRISLELAREPA